MVVGEFTTETELLVIGGGPAGYTAAFRAAELGVQTMIVDSRNELGGVCLHEGCVPSKTLLHIAEIINNSQRAAEFGIAFDEMGIEVEKTDAWLQATISKLAKGLGSRAKKLEVQRAVGQAHFEDSKHVLIAGGSIPRVKFRRAIIATGSRPKAHPALPFDPDHVLTPEQSVAMHARRSSETEDLEVTVPKTVLVVGSNYMAVEIAAIYSAFGSQTSLITEDNTLLPEVDADLTRVLQRSLASSIHELKLESHVDQELADSFDEVVVSVGHEANIESLNLGATKVQVDEDDFIVVDQQMRTADARILAAGDVTGHPMLADVALAQGRIAAEVVANHPSAFDARALPHAIFTDPNLAWVGVTEREAKDAGVEYAVAKAPWGLSGRAVGMNRSEGLTKILYEPNSKEVLGVGMVGTGACEMIGEASLAIEMAATLDDLALTLHPHPTMSELISDAARSVE